MRLTRIANATATAATVTGGIGLLGFLVSINAGWHTAALACAWTTLAVAPVLVAATIGALVGVWKRV